MRGAWTWMLVLSACGQAAPAPARESSDRATSAATAWVRVRSPDDQAMLEAPARALPDATSVERISASYSLRVREVLVSPGDRVEAGDPIVRVTSADLLSAAAEYEGARRRLETERARLAEVRALRGEGYATAERVFELERQERAHEATMRVAAAAIRAADVAPGRASQLLSRGGLTLRAHIAGVVRSVDVVAGDVLVEGGTFATIVGARSHRVEARFASLPPSDARFEFEDLTGGRTPLPAAPVRVVDAGDQGGFIVWFDVPSEAVIAPLTEGHVHVTLTAPEHVEIPTAALIARGPSRQVVRRRDGRVANVTVTVVMASGATAIVHGDLRVTDDVAADGDSASPAPATDEAP